MEGGSLAMSAGANPTIFGPIWSSCMHKCILLLVLRFLWVWTWMVREEGEEQSDRRILTKKAPKMWPNPFSCENQFTLCVEKR
jgi:hypothetical protein